LEVFTESGGAFSRKDFEQPPMIVATAKKVIINLFAFISRQFFIK